MEYKINVPQYDNGFKFEWEDNYKIEVNIIENTIIIKANKAGLISLARHLINLSQDNFNSGYHFHLDNYNALEDGSNEMIIEKL